MRLMPLAALALLSACATITTDTTQAIRVSSTPPGAACTLRNAVGNWKIASTPGEVLVKRNYSPLDITCTHPDGQSGQAVLEPVTRGRAYGNILLGGAPTIIDADTGAGYEYAPAEATIGLKGRP